MDLKSKGLLILLPLFLLTACKDEVQETEPEQLPLFTSMAPAETGIQFTNSIEEDATLNALKFDYMYNGGGVAAGDLDGDGLPELVFTGNMTPNKIYANKGGLKFEDKTDGSGLAAEGRWCTGVSMIDLNLDGLLDIYVCCMGDGITGRNRENLLFINRGNFKFSEEAREWGIADPGNSVQASWIDYDLDGDMDLIVCNQPGEFDLTGQQRLDEWRNPKHSKSNHLYRNDGRDGFKDVTEETGLLSYDYTLGVTTGDLDGDGWPDIYMSNDYIEPDRFYRNNHDGTFTESLGDHFRHTSNFGMGADLADINNDALPDIISVDMVAKDNYRQKTMMSAMNPEQFWSAVNAGYQWQYMRNSLQLNQGGGLFSEIAQMSGVAYTDWSWAPLFADFNNDGWKDLIVTNGYRRDSRNADKRKELKKLNQNRDNVSAEKAMEFLNSVPVNKIKNYFFQNNGDFTFSDLSDSSGFAIPSFSNGAVYADLDNDGDQDVVINNLLDPAFVMRNNTVAGGGSHWLKIKFNGAYGNPLGIGAKVLIKNGDDIQYSEMIMSRGYQSSTEPMLHFGLGDVAEIEALQIWWPDGKSQILRNVSADKTLSLSYQDAAISKEQIYSRQFTQLFAPYAAGEGINFIHQENIYDDYETQVLLPHKMSQFGPALATGDVDGDGMHDVFVGGAIGQSGGLFVQMEDGSFRGPLPGPWSSHAGQEDVGAVFFDYDGDGDADLYVVSGGNEFTAGSIEYKDRLYKNNGNYSFSNASDMLPDLRISGSRVLPADYDGDKDIDLLVCGRHSPGRYPLPERSVILENDGGKFVDVTANVAPDFLQAGMITDAVWTDFSGDKNLDLILVGEWTGIKMYKNSGGSFRDVSADYDFANKTGWYFSITATDLNKDGKQDYILGNLGKNYKYQASETEPFQIYASDFDANGKFDIVLGYFNEGVCYPVRGRQCSSEQLPSIKEKFPSYETFGKATLEDVYGSDLETALNYSATTFANAILLSNEDGFEWKELPKEAQVAPINDVIPGDFDADGQTDLIIAGNLFVSEVETGRADGGLGFFLKGDGEGGFEVLPPSRSGLYAGDDVRNLAIVRGSGGTVSLIVANNNAGVLAYRCLAVRTQ